MTGYTMDLGKMAFSWLFARQPPRESAGGHKSDGCKEDKGLLAVDGVIEALCRSVMNVPRRKDHASTVPLRAC